jgi:hypothetical protein
VVGLACCCLAALAIGLGGLYGYGNRTPATPVVVTPVVTAPVLTARAATDTALPATTTAAATGAATRLATCAGYTFHPG